MLKIIGIILIIGSFSALGLGAKKILAQRIDSLKSAISALDVMCSEISLRLTPIPEMLCKLCAEDFFPISEVFMKLKETIEKNSDLSFNFNWSKTFNDMSDELSFNESDKKIFIDLSMVLGRYDSDEQVKSLTYAKRRLESNLKLAENEMDNKGNVYKTCFVAAGVILVMVLI